MISTFYVSLGGVIVFVVCVIVYFAIFRRRPRKLNVAQLKQRWIDLQKLCANKKLWRQSIIDADKLLDDVLKRLRYKGKTGGARLVAAQRHLTNNETVWFGHKLRNRLVQDDIKTVSKQDTLEALSGFRQALKDLGALHNDKTDYDND